MDRASWHITEALNIPQYIRLMPLPPYSPELNPMEKVWQQLRKIKLSTAWCDSNSVILPFRANFTAVILSGLREIQKNKKYSYDSGSLKNRLGDCFF